ncbi:GNAT family N-acetyltransferase [Macrococcus carouselicus]|uniref:GNAT family N-acetyltransferase n=1 Tax=Macrococcus carouselicus TaxID=69969 RepID=A0A9Q8FQX8_9STAP|nr:GNAT family N-acetyltransferase [Macrococcus carouselicus]TDM02385.1 GNAT family N-acetyltransferase [Macrococcus carouselicus]
MIIREMNNDDIKNVSVLLNDYRMFYHKPNELDKCEIFLKERIDNKESQVFIAELNEEIIGFVQIYSIFSTVSLQRAYILNDLFVSENARKTGAGKKLIEKAFEFAEENAARYICLETGKDNEKAQRLYEKMGMSIDDMVYHYSKTIN